MDRVLEATLSWQDKTASKSERAKLLTKRLTNLECGPVIRYIGKTPVLFTALMMQPQFTRGLPTSWSCSQESPGDGLIVQPGGVVYVRDVLLSHDGDTLLVRPGYTGNVSRSSSAVMVAKTPTLVVSEALWVAGVNLPQPGSLIKCTTAGAAAKPRYLLTQPNVFDSVTAPTLTSTGLSFKTLEDKDILFVVPIPNFSPGPMVRLGGTYTGPLGPFWMIKVISLLTGRVGWIAWEPTSYDTISGGNS